MIGSMLPTLGLALALALAQGDATTATRDEVKKLQGTWQGASLELGGRSAPADFVAKGRYVFEDDRLTMYEGDTIVGKARIVLHPESNPKGIDLVDDETGKDKGQAKQVAGIYEIKDETLKLCFSPTRRPAEFASKGDAGVMTFRRPKTAP